MTNESAEAQKSSVLKLDVLGTSFSITVNESQQYLEKVLDQYSAAVKNTQNISGINDPLNVAVLTGYLLCDEINRMKQSEEKASGNAQEIEKRTIRLISALDQALKACTNG